MKTFKQKHAELMAINHRLVELLYYERRKYKELIELIPSLEKTTVTNKLGPAEFIEYMRALVLALTEVKQSLDECHSDLYELISTEAVDKINIRVVLLKLTRTLHQVTVMLNASIL